MTVLIQEIYRQLNVKGFFSLFQLLGPRLVKFFSGSWNARAQIFINRYYSNPGDYVPHLNFELVKLRAAKSVSTDADLTYIIFVQTGRNHMLLVVVFVYKRQ